MKTIIKVLIILLPALFALGPQARAAESATSLLARCAAKVNKSASIDAKFYLTIGQDRYDCHMTIAKQKFTMSTPQMHVWYDGKTQWTYAIESAELSITEPTADELLESNPFAILNHYAKAYTCRLLAAEDGMKRVELAAKSKSASVRKAVVTINPKTDLPVKVVMTLSNGRVIAATVTGITTGSAKPASTFIYNKSKFPAKEIIDLR
ncbi:MAG: LolA-like putative outer membrane lipoprotein chaperone [Bacteroidales bacterium]|nr:LolA-like putative outer membrane lipoprotein chaperone [Bacteroidales bacterium]